MHPPVKVYFEDNHILVVNKPANIPVQADISGDMDFLELLKCDLKNRYEKPGNVFLGLVHRLDRPVSGIMVFAKTSKAAARLSEQMRLHKISKIYLAVAKGKLTNNYGKMQDYLYKNEKTNKVSSVSKETPGAKLAELEYELIACEDDLSLVKIKLLTGRPHQIRVQFSSRGCYLLGDFKYGSTDKNVNGLSLLSYILGFEHPTKKEWMEFRGEIPDRYPWNVFGKKLKLI